MIWSILSRLAVFCLLARCGLADPISSTGSLPLLVKLTSQPELDIAVSNKSYGQYSSNPAVSTSCGTYEGVSYSDGGNVKYERFVGIRYAEPPVGPLRFKNPVPWGGCRKEKTHQATQFCPPCMQAKKAALKSSGMLPSEDCLCLNIYRPAGCKPGSKKPVLVYLYGSFFVQGSTAQSDNEGGYLAHYGDFIVVTMNYRLGAFGFLASDDKEISANPAFYDTLLATKWVKQNIEDFGGDSKSIIVSGHGAGGSLTLGYMVNPDIPEDLVDGVMILSPDFNQEDFADLYQLAYRKSQYIARYVGCDSKGYDSSLGLGPDEVKCLKNADPELLAEASLSIPIDDGNGVCAWNRLLPHSERDNPTIDDRLDKGQFRKGKRVYIGAVPTETYSSFIGLAAETLSDAEEFIKSEIRPIIRDQSRKNIEAVLDYYVGGVKPSNSFEISKRTTLALNNVCYGCPIYDLDSHLAKFNEVYAYVYTYVTSCYKDSKKRKFGAYHGDDTPINFGLPLREKDKYSDYDRAVSLEIISIWSDFVYGRKMKWPAIDDSSHTLAYLEGDTKRNYYKESPYREICPRIDA